MRTLTGESRVPKSIRTNGRVGSGWMWVRYSSGVIPSPRSTRVSFTASSFDTTSPSSTGRVHKLSVLNSSGRLETLANTTHVVANSSHVDMIFDQQSWVAIDGSAE